MKRLLSPGSGQLRVSQNMCECVRAAGVWCERRSDRSKCILVEETMRFLYYFSSTSMGVRMLEEAIGSGRRLKRILD